MADDIFGLSTKALELTEKRAVLLSSNIVNSSTPNYKARDIDFQKLLKEQQQGITRSVEDAPILFRVPNHISLDGNTVDPEIARKDFIENALRYQVNLTFVQNKTRDLMKAIKGE